MLAYGWRRVLIAFLAGAASALALAPIQCLADPVRDLSDAGLAGGWLSRRTLERRITAAIAGWWFGFGYFVAGLYWVGYAFLVDAKTFGWLLPVAVTGLPAYLALYTALGLAAARRSGCAAPTRILALAATLTGAEWLRGHLLTGFPWNVFGYALTEPLALAQSVSLFGIWGLTFVPSRSSPARPCSPTTWRTRRIRGARWSSACSFSSALDRLRRDAAWRHPTTYVDGVNLRIMQPNMQQDEKFNYANKEQVMERYLRLSNRATGPQLATACTTSRILIWPESAFPFFLTREPDALAQIAGSAEPSHRRLSPARCVAAPDASDESARTPIIRSL